MCVCVCVCVHVCICEHACVCQCAELDTYQFRPAGQRAVRVEAADIQELTCHADRQQFCPFNFCVHPASLKCSSKVDLVPSHSSSNESSDEFLSLSNELSY